MKAAAQTPRAVNSASCGNAGAPASGLARLSAGSGSRRIGGRRSDLFRQRRLINGLKPLLLAALVLFGVDWPAMQIFIKTLTGKTITL